LALLPELLQPAPQERDPPAGKATVGFELRFAWPARPEAAAEALEVLPHPAHPRQVVLELRELDLELALGARRMLREDVEDQLRPVDDTRFQRILERPLLCRLQLVVHDEHLGLGVLVGPLELLELPLTEVRTTLGPGTVLDELADRRDERRLRELTQLGQLHLGIDSLGQHGGDEPALRRGVRLA